MIEYIHGDRSVTIGEQAADTTVLDYLREAGRTGTKEGCASGDCGACTVVTVSLRDGKLCYEPINACIAPLGALQGKQLITVEDLAQDENLHPVQQAMVDAHASQCGFCTPGFVMSLFAAYHADDLSKSSTPDRHQIAEALGGNLCRCTGYRPIIDAASTALGQRAEDAFDRSADATREQLQAIAAKPVRTRSSTYLMPRTSNDVAADLDAHPEARIVAGGTDLMLEVTQNLQDIPTLIDLTHVEDLHHIEVDDTRLRFGAAVTHNECLPTFLMDYPECEELIQRFGSLQIRGRGTIAGNVANASPIGDWPPLLLALDGEVEITSQSGVRVVAASEFFLDYRKTVMQKGEFISAVLIPRRPDGLFLRAYKISKRFEDDISSVCGVFALTLNNDRIVDAKIGCGGVAATPLRAAHCEAALQDVSLNDPELARCAEMFDKDFAPITDARATAEFRSQVLKNLLLRAQAEYRGDATRVHA